MEGQHTGLQQLPADGSHNYGAGHSQHSRYLRLSPVDSYICLGPLIQLHAVYLSFSSVARALVLCGTGESLALPFSVAWRAHQLLFARLRITR